MKQAELPLLCRLDAPSVVSSGVVRNLASYREAVRWCFDNRKVRHATQRTVAEYVGSQPSHMSEYLSHDDQKRDMPAKFIKTFELFCGNTAISQWIAAGSSLTVLEEMQLQRSMA